MTFTIQSQRKGWILIACAIMGLLPATVLAKATPVTSIALLERPRLGERWNRRVTSSTKTVMFQQAASGETDSTAIAKIRLGYFTSNDCSGSLAGSGAYTTPDGPSFTISVGTPFGLVAASAWNVGSTQLSIADMTTIQSMAITFKSTSSNTPQANFSGLSFACVPVTCTAGPSGECTSASGTQSFTLKTTAAVGDPADSGVIGCQNTGTSPNLFDIVVATSDQSTGQGWSGTLSTTGATSTTDGATNTATIVSSLGTGTSYAARTCSELSVAGGFTSGWFLPSGGNIVGTQQNCLYTNREAIATGSVAAGGSGFASALYWSSTEASSTNAWRQSFSSSIRSSGSKVSSLRVRCSRAF